MFSSSKSVCQTSTSDYLGIFSAVVCMIHCLAGPILLGASAHLHEQAHLWLAPEWNFLFLAIGFGAVWYSARHTFSTFMRFFLWLTYGLLASAMLAEVLAHGHGIAEMLHYLVYLASAALIGAHILNLRKRFI